MKGEHKAQVSLKYQNREENGPSEAPVRVGRKMEEKSGDLVEFNSRAAFYSAPSATQFSTSLRVHLRAEVMSLQLGQQGFLLIYLPIQPSPAFISRRPEELRTGLFH